MVCTSFTSLLAAATLASTFSVGSTTAKPVVSPSIRTTLLTQRTVDLIITLNGGVDKPVNGIRSSDFTNRGQKISALVKNLEDHASIAQNSVDRLLAQESTVGGPARFTSSETFWISNQKSIKGATAGLVDKLTANMDIAEIREEIIVPIPRVLTSTVTTTTATNTTMLRTAASSTTPTATNEWGVVMVSAPSVWALGFRGQNVVIGSIDTGVMTTHASISANFRSSYGWFDPAGRKPKPCDDNGHGTHTVGTMVGANVGVAPGAKFIACRACTSMGCSESNLLACAQFMTCPTTGNGKRDCTQAPDIVSNSWGGGQGSTFFAGAISAWQKAGIIPVFANGNAGPACMTANSPGDDPNVIAVGATDALDGLAGFSSKGPAKIGGLLKPEVSAPGVNVRSAWPSGTSAYAALSGTSMATPHVSGVIALLLSKRPTLTYAQVKTAITSTTNTTSLKPTGYTCGGTADGTFPNNQYGFGRINALAAIAKV